MDLIDFVVMCVLALALVKHMDEQHAAVKAQLGAIQARVEVCGE